MPVRTSDAEWKGSLKEGSGNMRFGSFEGPYSFASRFENGTGTNPEELLGAAHAGCFSMALTGILNQAGYHPESVHTTARVTIEFMSEGFAITKIALTTEAKVPGIDDNTFLKHAEEAKKGCPVSKALAAVPEITLNATLI
jgi:lipoyl-dependent peroxiredoxin